MYNTTAMATYLTFDIGTTSLKTALVSDEGRVMALHTEEYAFVSPQPDWAEMPPETYWNAAVNGARTVMARASAAPADVAALGFSSQGQTFVPIDRTGKPLYNAIVWTDARAQQIADEWEREWLPKDSFRQTSGYPSLAAGLTVFKAAWLARHLPDVLKAWKLLCLPDYLIYRMTGEAATDHVIAQFSGFFDFRSQKWVSRLLEAAGVAESQLPRVLPSGTPAGTLLAGAAAQLGVREGTPVCVGANDQICGALGSGNATPGIVSETTGTALALVVTTQHLLEDARMLVGRHASPDRFYALPYANTSAIVLKWLRDMTAPGVDYDSFLADASRIEPGCGGLAALPHFAGSASPTFNPDARGAFSGLTLGHSRAHLARAIMESCACMLRECVSLVQEHGVTLERVRSLGGAAKSDLWLQIKADTLGFEVERPECSEAASLGAAVLAAAGTAAFPSIEEAARAWYRPSRVFEPDPARRAAYEEVYLRYLRLYEKLYGNQKTEPASGFGAAE